MVFLELDRRGHYERSLCREDIDRTTAACRCGMTWGKENNAWIASFLNNSFKHSTSVCLHLICLPTTPSVWGVSVYWCLSTFFLSPCPLSPTALLSICRQFARLEPWSCRLTLALLCMNIHLTGTCCSYYLPIISKSIRRKWDLMWGKLCLFLPFFK